MSSLSDTNTLNVIETFVRFVMMHCFKLNSDCVCIRTILYIFYVHAYMWTLLMTVIYLMMHAGYHCESYTVCDVVNYPVDWYSYTFASFMVCFFNWRWQQHDCLSPTTTNINIFRNILIEYELSVEPKMMPLAVYNCTFVCIRYARLVGKHYLPISKLWLMIHVKWIIVMPWP